MSNVYGTRWALFGSLNICLPKAMALRQETGAVCENLLISSHRFRGTFETILYTQNSGVWTSHSYHSPSPRSFGFILSFIIVSMVLIDSVIQYHHLHSVWFHHSPSSSSFSLIMLQYFFFCIASPDVILCG